MSATGAKISFHKTQAPVVRKRNDSKTLLNILLLKESSFLGGALSQPTTTGVELDAILRRFSRRGGAAVRKSYCEVVGETSEVGIGLPIDICIINYHTCFSQPSFD